MFAYIWQPRAGIGIKYTNSVPKQILRLLLVWESVFAVWVHARPFLYPIQIGLVNSIYFMQQFFLSLFYIYLFFLCFRPCPLFFFYVFISFLSLPFSNSNPLPLAFLYRVYSLHVHILRLLNETGRHDLRGVMSRYSATRIPQSLSRSLSILRHWHLCVRQGQAERDGSPTVYPFSTCAFLRTNERGRKDHGCATGWDATLWRRERFAFYCWHQHNSTEQTTGAMLTSMESYTSCEKCTFSGEQFISLLILSAFFHLPTRARRSSGRPARRGITRASRATRFFTLRVHWDNS